MLINFLREDFSEVIGAYHDGAKIYLSRHVNGNVENIDAPFVIDEEASISGIEQLAGKISMICTQYGWTPSKMGLCLDEDVAVTFQTQFGTVAPNEVDDAVKIWAIAQVGKDALFDSIKSDGEVWMEAIEGDIAKDYVKYWRQNNMNLCVLTIMPEEITMRLNLTKPITHAEFAAEVVATKKRPNLIADYLSAWNYRRLAVAILAGFFIVMTVIFAQISYEYEDAAAQLDTIKIFIEDHAEELDTKKIIEQNIAEMRRLNAQCATQESSIPTFNSLVKLGQIADGETYLTKIKTYQNVIELEGNATDTDEIKNYVKRLKTITPHVKLGNFSSDEDSTKFVIYLTLKD